MSENTTAGQKHSRSTSITKAPHTRSHQRKSSINVQTHLYSIPEKKSHFTASPSPSPINTSFPSKKYASLPLWRRYLQGVSTHLDTWLDPSASPVLPHTQRTKAFGGPVNKSLWSQFFRSKWTRFILLFYIVFSVFLSINHIWHWLTSGPRLDPRFGDHWVAQRTYDQDKQYSMLNTMAHGLKMSKLFSKTEYAAAENVQPFWLKSAQPPMPDDVSIVTAVTLNTWPELVRLAQHWKGPISATLHVPSDENTASELQSIQHLYQQEPPLFNHVDIHLAFTAGQLSIQFPRNAERNLARLFARTDFVMDIPSHIVPASELRKTLAANKDKFDSLLRHGDLLIIPTFGFPEYDKEKYSVPNHKEQLVDLVDNQTMMMVDKHFKDNSGPTDWPTWRNAVSPYRVTEYELHYEPIVIESKTVQPWCAERFLDSRSACLFSNYLAGSELWVLPDDFAVQMPDHQAAAISDFDVVIENRLYAKFKWEQCVHHARQLDALGLWKTPRSEHILSQCSSIIRNWGKGFMPPPEPAATSDCTDPPANNNATCGPIGYDEREKRTYELVVCQQPLHARMCGFGEKDRRPIDPPPIVKLNVQQDDQQTPVDMQSLQSPFFVLHVTLWSADREEERNIISNPPKCTRVLMGSLVSSPSLLKDPEGEQGLYFAFPDLSIRTEGQYTLRFSLMKLVSSDFQTDAKSKIIAQIFSDPFTVYSAKKNQLNFQRHLQSRA
ncbi:velvet factor-domain-containing protein [Radiomyces spectabilis]|uniref:velvet factor-domain-containing protein n=1 Tax=Radiomyces spectabilis TaxID=64574 RepID=UPI0022200A02|nr:velvet factor-domain-containing protein [Radiomyces spectabilis]KAI8370358.1 velvet factor-domain-containing protein [Radiomyces spectabilis]